MCVNALRSRAAWCQGWFRWGEPAPEGSAVHLHGASSRVGLRSSDGNFTDLVLRTGEAAPVCASGLWAGVAQLWCAAYDLPNATDLQGVPAVGLLGLTS